MNLRMTLGIVFGLLVASTSPVLAHDVDKEPPVADVVEDEPSDESEDEVEAEEEVVEEDSTDQEYPPHLLWYDARKLHQPRDPDFDFFKEIKLRAHGFETAKQNRGLDVSGTAMSTEISLRPWSWAFESPVTDEENRIEVGVYARYEIHKFKSKHPERYRWYHSTLSLGLEFTYVNFDELGAEWMITLRPCAYVAETKGKSEDPSNTYELFYQNSAGYEISGVLEYYGAFRPLERGSRSGFFPSLSVEAGYAEHRGEKIKSTLTKANQIDEPHKTTRVWCRATLWLFQYDFDGLLISVGGSAFGNEVRADQFGYPNMRHNRKVRTFTGGPSIRILIADHLLLEATGFYGRESPKGIGGRGFRGLELSLGVRW